jgi:hypothetical protein
LKVASDTGHAAIAFRALVDLGEVQRLLGRREAAERIWQEALKRIGETHRQHPVLVSALITLGRQASESGQAREWLVEGLVLARDGVRWDLARGLETVVEVASAEGQVELALQLAGAAAALRDRMGTPPWPSERARVEAATTRARRSLTEDAADVAWMRGWTSPVNQTLAMALRFLQHPLSDRAADHPPIFFNAASSGP